MKASSFFGIALSLIGCSSAFAKIRIASGVYSNPRYSCLIELSRSMTSDGAIAPYSFNMKIVDTRPGCRNWWPEKGVEYSCGGWDAKGSLKNGCSSNYGCHVIDSHVSTNGGLVSFTQTCLKNGIWTAPATYIHQAGLNEWMPNWSDTWIYKEMPMISGLGVMEFNVPDFE